MLRHFIDDFGHLDSNSHLLVRSLPLRKICTFLINHIRCIDSQSLEDLEWVTETTTVVPRKQHYPSPKSDRVGALPPPSGKGSLKPKRCILGKLYKTKVDECPKFSRDGSVQIRSLTSPRFAARGPASAEK